MEQNKSCIGIDALTVSNLKIERIENIERLVRTQNVRVQYAEDNQQNYVTIGKDGCIRMLDIRDEKKFNRLILGVKNGYTFSTLALTVTNILGNNMDNVSWCMYNEYIKFVLKEYLPSMYGIYLCSEEMLIKKFEMNINIWLSQSYDAYNRALENLWRSLPIRRAKNLRAGTKEEQVDSYCKRNKSIKVALYNKTSEMEEKGELCKVPREQHRLLRIELVLMERSKILDVLGTNRWHELNDEIVAKQFDKAFEAYFVEPFQKWQIQCSKMLRTKIKNYRKCGRNWKSTLMAFLRDDKEYQILDIEQIFAELQDKNGNLSRIKKGFWDAEYKMDHSRYLNRDIEKINEIFMAEKQIFLYTLACIQQTESDEQKK